MNGISNATSANTAGSSTAGTPPASSGSGGISSLNQSDFIKLITAQLQNQDPTQPTNPQDLANEFASLSTVTGIDNLTKTVDGISAGAGAAQIGQAATLIGKTVAVNGGASVAADAAGAAVGGFSLASPATNAVVSITDPVTGHLVGSVHLSNLPAGMSKFTWNGASPGHVYGYSVSAASGTSPVAATTFTNAPVASVNVSGGAPTLDLVGGSQSVALTQINSIIGG